MTRTCSLLPLLLSACGTWFDPGRSATFAALDGPPLGVETLCERAGRPAGACAPVRRVGVEYVGFGEEHSWVRSIGSNWYGVGHEGFLARVTKADAARIADVLLQIERCPEARSGLYQVLRMRDGQRPGPLRVVQPVEHAPTEAWPDLPCPVTLEEGREWPMYEFLEAVVYGPEGYATHRWAWASKDPVDAQP